jgi:hypothetical protein
MNDREKMKIFKRTMLECVRLNYPYDNEYDRDYHIASMYLANLYINTFERKTRLIIYLGSLLIGALSGIFYMIFYFQKISMAYLVIVFIGAMGFYIAKIISYLKSHGVWKLKEK